MTKTTERLTIKQNGFYFISEHDAPLLREVTTYEVGGGNALTKLGKLEDAEQRFGVDLIKLAKAMKILIKKQVNIADFLLTDSLKDFNKTVFWVKNELTKKEYDIVKEVIK